MKQRPILLVFAAVALLTSIALTTAQDRGAPLTQRTGASRVVLPAVEVHQANETVTPTATIGVIPTPESWCDTAVPTPAEGAQVMTGSDGALRPVLCVRLIVGGRLVSGVAPEVVLHRETYDQMYRPYFVGNSQNGSHYMPYQILNLTDLWDVAPGSTLDIDVAVPYQGMTYWAHTAFTVQPTATQRPTETPQPTLTMTPTMVIGTPTATPTFTPTVTLQPTP